MVVATPAAAAAGHRGRGRLRRCCCVFQYTQFRNNARDSHNYLHYWWLILARVCVLQIIAQMKTKQKRHPKFPDIFTTLLRGARSSLLWSHYLYSLRHRCRRGEALELQDMLSLIVSRHTTQTHTTQVKTKHIAQSRGKCIRCRLNLSTSHRNTFLDLTS